MMYPNGWGCMPPLRRSWVGITIKLIGFCIHMTPSPSFDDEYLAYMDIGDEIQPSQRHYQGSQLAPKYDHLVYILTNPRDNQAFYVLSWSPK